jgi:serine/threonine protein kinase
MPFHTFIDSSGKQYFSLKILKKGFEQPKYHLQRNIKFTFVGRIVKLQQLQHIRDEISILARLRCRFTPELRAVFQDENSVYIMTDYLPGGLLS